MRQLLRHHAAEPASPLQMISTPPPDYGAGARYSLYDDSVALASWLRAEWAAAQQPAPTAARAAT